MVMSSIGWLCMLMTSARIRLIHIREMRDDLHVFLIWKLIVVVVILQPKQHVHVSYLWSINEVTWLIECLFSRCRRIKFNKAILFCSSSLIVLSMITEITTMKYIINFDQKLKMDCYFFVYGLASKDTAVF